MDYGATAYLNFDHPSIPQNEMGLKYEDGIVVEITLKEMNSLECKAGWIHWQFNLGELQPDRIILAAWGDTDRASGQLRDFKVEFTDIQVGYY